MYKIFTIMRHVDYKQPEKFIYTINEDDIDAHEKYDTVYQTTVKGWLYITYNKFMSPEVAFAQATLAFLDYDIMWRHNSYWRDEFGKVML